MKTRHLVKQARYIKKPGLSPMLSGVIYMLIILTGIIIVITSLYPHLTQYAYYRDITQTKKCYTSFYNSLISLSQFSSSSTSLFCTLSHSSLFVKTNYLLFFIKHIPFNMLSIFNDVPHTIEDGVYVYNNTSYYTMGNRFLEIRVNQTNDINISNMVYVTYKKNAYTFGPLDLEVNDDAMMGIGKGKVISEEEGNYLQKGRIIIEVENNNTKYNLTLTLLPFSDFLIIGIED